MKKRGVFGGTFNPIHTGHLILAEYVCNELNLDELIFIPTKNPPHKNNNEIADEKTRLEMIKIAIKGNNRLSVSDIELKNSSGKKSYTIDTLDNFKKYYNNKMYLIIGFDSYLELDTWKEPQNICRTAEVIVLKRPGYKDRRNNKFKNKVKFLDSPLISISSTIIRNNIRNNKSIKYLVPDKIENYIIKNKLFTAKYGK